MINLEWGAFSTVTMLDGKSKCMLSWFALWHKSLRLRCAFPLEISQQFMKYSNSLTMLNSVWAPFLPIYLNKLSVGAVCAWLTDLHKKRQKCLLPNWQRSFSDNRGILEWLFKRILPPSPNPLPPCCWKFAIPLDCEEIKGWGCIFIVVVWRKTKRRARCGMVAREISGPHAKKGGRLVHPYAHLDWS